MKKIKFLVVVIGVLSCVLQSCNNGKTYAEMKEDEADAINAWILSHDYKVISEKDFYAQDTITHENDLKARTVRKAKSFRTVRMKSCHVL